MKRGFTLVEMVVVLLVIAVVTHFALRACGELDERRRTERADRQLAEIAAAARAFVADTGRLPVATNGTLCELWSRPADVPSYRVVVTNGVAVAAGWRGPYVRLAPGRTQLFDPWGNPFVTRDEAGFARLTLTNAHYAAAVSHYGPNSRTRRTELFFPQEPPVSTLTVGLAAEGASAGGTCEVGWYGPGAGPQGVTGAVAQVSLNAQHTFRGLTPGRRMLVVSQNAARLALREVEVRAGDNLITVNVP